MMEEETQNKLEQELDDAFGQYVMQTVIRIIRDKEERGAQPWQAMMSEIRSRINKAAESALNSMVRSGLLTYHRTLNDISFEFTPPK